MKKRNPKLASVLANEPKRCLCGSPYHANCGRQGTTDVMFTPPTEPVEGPIPMPVEVLPGRPADHSETDA